MNIVELETKTRGRAEELARQYELTGYSRLKKHDLAMRLLQAEAEKQGLLFGGGILDVVQDGLGFLRRGDLLPSPEDIYVSQSQIRRFGLRPGDTVIGQVRAPKENEKYFGLLRVETVNNMDPEQAKLRPWFDRLTPIFPNQAFKLETGQTPALDPPARYAGADRARPARHDRLASQGRQDHHSERNRQRDQCQPERRAHDGRPDRRAARGSDRHGPLGRGGGHGCHL